MIQAQGSTPQAVQVSTTVDGVLVRLSGSLGFAELPALRGALLANRPAGCDDVLVDAGAVTAVDDDALAVLVAAAVWAEQTGARLSYTRCAVSLEETARALGVLDAFPALARPGDRSAVPSAGRLVGAR